MQEELTTTENKIAFARQFYNDAVLGYNNKLQTFPTVLFAQMLKFEKREFFQAEEIGGRRTDLPIGPIMDFLCELVDRTVASPKTLLVGSTSHPDTLRPAFVRVPIALLTLALSGLLPSPKPDSRPFDATGAVLLALVALGVIVALTGAVPAEAAERAEFEPGFFRQVGFRAHPHAQPGAD